MAISFSQVKGKKARLEKNMWHWFNIVIFSLLAIVTTISAVRLIVNNVKEYNFFADTWRYVIDYRRYTFQSVMYTTKQIDYLIQKLSSLGFLKFFVLVIPIYDDPQTRGVNLIFDNCKSDEHIYCFELLRISGFPKCPKIGELRLWNDLDHKISMVEIWNCSTKYRALSIDDFSHIVLKPQIN